MAVAVIVVGALMALAGFVSLAAGFDIVMTERGAAMTLGGITAIAGGILTMAMGLALQQLKAIRRLLEQRAPKMPLRAEAGVRPVLPVPTLPDTHLEVPQTSGKIVALQPEASIPAKPATSALALAAAGSAAAVGLAAALPAAAKDAGHGDTGEPVEAPDQSAEEDVVGLVGQEPLPVLPDLEAELMKALSATAAPVLDDASSAAQPDESEDLVAEPTIGDWQERPTTDAPGETATEELAEADDTLAEEAEAFVERTVDPDDEPEAVAPPEAEPEPDNLQVLLSSEIDDDIEEEVEQAALSSLTDDEEEPSSRSSEPGEEAADEADDAFEATAEDDAPTEQSGAVVEEDTRRPLGSYRAGDRSYTMYSDGTVEAITDQGVERFSSMDALRRHLSRT